MIRPVSSCNEIMYYEDFIHPIQCCHPNYSLSFAISLLVRVIYFCSCCTTVNQLDIQGCQAPTGLSDLQDKSQISLITDGSSAMVKGVGGGAFIWNCTRISSTTGTMYHQSVHLLERYGHENLMSNVTMFFNDYLYMLWYLYVLHLIEWLNVYTFYNTFCYGVQLYILIFSLPHHPGVPLYLHPQFLFIFLPPHHNKEMLWNYNLIWVQTLFTGL